MQSLSQKSPTEVNNRSSLPFACRDTKNNQILAAAHNVVSGKHSPLDLMRVKCDKKTYYAFLSVGFGLLADIDIESESLRLLGGHRFSVWAVVRALGMRLLFWLHFLN